MRKIFSDFESTSESESATNFMIPECECRKVVNFILKKKISFIEPLARLCSEAINKVECPKPATIIGKTKP